MYGDRLLREGHAKPVRDSKLKSLAFATMTGGATRSFERTGEFRPGLRLQRSARTRPSGYGRTSRNTFEGRKTEVSGNGEAYWRDAREHPLTIDRD